MTLDRPENKQVREYFTSQAAVDAAKKGGRNRVRRVDGYTGVQPHRPAAGGV